MEIAESLAAQGIEIDRRKILLEQPIKELGEHAVDIKLNAGVNAIVKINVISEDAKPAPADVPAETPADA
jgi:large subunit ribosomal protein L9